MVGRAECTGASTANGDSIDPMICSRRRPTLGATTRRLWRRSVWLGLLLLAVPATAVAQGTRGIDQMAWLSGCWAAESGEPGSGEVWLPPAGGTMFGVNRAVAGGETVFFEWMQLREGEASLEFVASPLGTGTTVFAATTIEPRRVVFENPGHDFPQRVLYARIDDRIEARIEGTVVDEDGQDQERAADFFFRRVPCEELGGEVEIAPPVDRLGPDGKASLLFIGNSLTYSNELPGLIGTLLESVGIPSEIEGVLGPNLGLQDHWQERSVRAKIRRGSFDFVILQQGPSATEGRPSLLEYGERFAQLIHEAGSRPGFYMVWPAVSRAFDFDGVATSYRMAATSTDGHLFAVGDSWRAAWRLDPELALYGPDGFHPSRLGSILAAVVFFEGLTGRPAPAEPPSQWEIEPVTWEVLLSAAAAVRGPEEGSPTR